MIFYCAFSAFLNAVIGLVCGIAVLFKDWRNPRNLTFALSCLAIALWSWAYWLWQLAGTAGEALLYCRLLTAASASILIVYYQFVRILLGLGSGRWTVLGIFWIVVLAALSPTGLLVRGVEPKMMFLFWPVPGPLYPVYLAVFAGYGLGALGLVVRAYRHAPTPRERNQLRWIWVANGIGILGGSTNFFLWYDIPIPPFGNVFVGLYIAAVGYSILRRRLVEVDYALILFGSYVAAVLPFAAVLVGIERLARMTMVDAGHGTALWATSCGVVLFFFFLVAPGLKRWIDALLARTLLRDRFERRDELGALAGRITSMRGDEAICRETIRVMHDVLEAPAAIYLRGDLEEPYERRAEIGFDTGHLPARLSSDEAIVELLGEYRQHFRLDEIETHPELPGLAGRQAALLAFRQVTGAQIAFPIFGDVRFFGLVLLGGRSRRRLFSELDMSLLDGVCGHIGLSLRARQLERRANQTEKLISLGTLAAGLAHELRNPLVSIQTFASLLAEMPDDGGIPAEFKATVMRDVRRIAGIVENVSAFAANNQVTFAWVRLDEVVRQAREIVAADLADAAVTFELVCDRSQPVYASQNQLLQVVINLLNNAAQALRGREHSRVVVTVRAVDLEDGRPGMELTVADNGPGIAPEILPRMFEPFTTTKATGARSGRGGMGLGLAIVKRIIDGHNGRINVRSTPGSGATFVITLPCEAASP